MAIEEPRYDVVQRYDAFELRRYQPFLVAETRVSGDFEAVGSEAFRILAGYIFGNNQHSAKIAMTAPVNQTPDVSTGEAIAARSPDLQYWRPDEPGWYTFTFMMPSKFTLDTLPRPNDPRITLKLVDGRLIAARGYSGAWSVERYRRNESALLAAVRATGLQPVGMPVFARYNSPFTPWFLRRNEVLIEIRPDPERT